jgi:acyl carrier protein
MDTRFIRMLRPFLKFSGDEPIEPESDLRKLGLDSMQAIELMFTVEDTFGVSLPDEELTDTTFATAGNLWRAVRAAIDEQTGAEGAA